MSVERIVDPAGWMWRHNRDLVLMLAEAPEFAAMFRSIMDQAHLWAGQRGIAIRNVRYEQRLTREGRIVVWLYDETIDPLPNTAASRPREVTVR